jgi:phosphatidylserine/phosphatidylglycerophosphate/cardiolipin synthase-like enzyme
MPESHLARSRQWLDEAESSLDIAMYSLSSSSQEVMQAIRRAKDRGVRVRLLLEQAATDRKNPEGSLSAQFEDQGIDVRYINQIMHHKFALIDSRGSDRQGHPRLISGSANWSNAAATVYDENTLFIEADPRLLQDFRQEFDRLWLNSRDFSWGNLTSDLAADSLPIPNDSPFEAETAFTSNNFENTISRYGAGFRAIPGRNTVSDRIVQAILSAKSSISIASGHYRSYAIAEAIVKAKEIRPELNIRIYLDAQEYISLSTQRKQKAEQTACLNTANTTVEKSDCYDRGYYYSYEAQAAGIDLRFKSYAYRWHYTYAPQMHHKYILIDDEILLTGSYNFSDNAEHATMENLLIFSGEQHPELIQSFRSNFEAMWSLNRHAFKGFMDSLAVIDPVPLVFPPMALTWQEVTALKDTLFKNCPALNSADYRDFPEKHKVCPRTE